jgi:hypothetical protein
VETPKRSGPSGTGGTITPVADSVNVVREIGGGKYGRRR